VLTVQGAMLRQTEFKQTLCADCNGFSLHAAVRCAADDRDALEQLCRTITRPALANERVQINASGQVVLKLKTAWRDGTTHLVMSPLEFMQRLAARVPRPRLHLIRFGVRITSLREVSGPPLREHGVLAPNAKLRALVVPQEPEAPAQAVAPAACEAMTPLLYFPQAARGTKQKRGHSCDRRRRPRWMYQRLLAWISQRMICGARSPRCSARPAQTSIRSRPQ
jgi:hypothetical protein